MKLIARVLAAASLLLIGVAGCGSGGGGTSAPQLQQKTAAITFSTISSAHAAPLQGIQISMKLPAGTSITDMATAVTGHNSSGRVVPGTYTPADRTATFSVLQTSFTPPANFISFGDFATLTCDITPGVTLDPSSFSLAPGDIQMTGVDSSGSTVNLVIPVRLSVSFGF